jgi:hypothetical protein
VMPWSPLKQLWGVLWGRNLIYSTGPGARVTRWL